jgi:uncharacterized protein YkwD
MYSGTFMGSAFFLTSLKYNQLNAADIILGVTVVLFTWLGYRQGFINSFFVLAKWAIALLLAALFYIPVSGWLTQLFVVDEEWQWPLSFCLVFLSGFLLLSLFFSFLKKIISPEAQYSFTNKITGLIPGFLTGIAVAIILAKLFMVSVWYTPEKDNKSYMLSSMLQSSGWLDNKFENIFNEPQQISGAVESVYTESEDFKSATFQAMPELEDQLLNLVNGEREKRGLKILVKDDRLLLAARNHAADMFLRGYFSHNTPDGIDPFQRMKKIGITYRSAGENLAHSYNLDSAHTGLMNSTGHRENILNTHFGKVGIAVLASDTKGLMVVQEFSN